MSTCTVFSIRKRKTDTSVSLACYRVGTALATPLARPFLQVRARRGKEDRDRLGERLGVARVARPPGALAWLHAASLGESLALLPLIDRLRARDLAVVLTTGTRSSANVLATRLPAGALHQYAPLDLPKAAGAFLDYWRPAILVLAESEIWPNTLRACAARDVPVALVNGRLSDRSLARWARAPGTCRELFGGLSACIVQSDTHAARFSALGARDVTVAGNLKHDRPPPPVDVGALARFRAALGNRPVVVAASTHDGEEALVLAAHQILSARHPDLLTILLPRDITRAPEILELSARMGLVTATRSGTDTVADGTAILVADTFGETGLWLRLATVAIIGKTFGNGGGQTPIEAAHCATAIVHGPSTFNFAEVFAALDARGGAVQTEASGLGETVELLLRDEARRSATVCAAADTVDALSGATARTLARLDPLLPAAWARLS